MLSNLSEFIGIYVQILLFNEIVILYFDIS